MQEFKVHPSGSTESTWCQDPLVTCPDKFQKMCGNFETSILAKDLLRSMSPADLSQVFDSFSMIARKHKSNSVGLQNGRTSPGGS